MKTSVIGYPRVGSLRELKFETEKYFRGEIQEDRLLSTAAALRKTHWLKQVDHQIDYVPCNDFSLYDTMLDTAVLLNAVPERYRALGLSPLDEYFAMARGYQGASGDVKALAMKKWFNTNYHYLVPELGDDTLIKLTGTKPFDVYTEARALGVETKPVMTGPFTFLKLAHITGEKQLDDYIDSAAGAYRAMLDKFNNLGTQWVQFDEPFLVMDLSDEDTALFTALYGKILTAKAGVKVLLQTYFGDIRDCYSAAISLPFDGIGLDFTEGKQSLELVETNGFPDDKTLFAGLVNGKNIWKNNYEKTYQTVSRLQKHCGEIVLSVSCSLLHVPYTLDHETALPEDCRKYFAFAEEKLRELCDLKEILTCGTPLSSTPYQENVHLFAQPRTAANPAIRAKISTLSEADFTRTPAFAEREKLQKDVFRLPLLPTTTIGSFPQTTEIKAKRAEHKKGTLPDAQYEDFNKQEIAKCVALQEELGLDVLVHGEFERNDMVEYFGERLDGFLFTEKAWVQSYGTRCVKPPILWGDVSRKSPITVPWSVYAQSLTEKPMKGMLTGPVTILNWSFPREDIPLQECAYQIALAIRDEAADLESNGLRMIQVDEAALREKLPLRKSDWRTEYLNWAIPAFRLVHSGMRPETQIHTHMCYSEFADIIKDIDAMDADVITFEASRSDLSILDVLHETGFRTQVGPGVYDIHSPRIPSVEETKAALHKMLGTISKEKLWVNPDCGLKTRGNEETVPSLKHMIEAARDVRAELN